MYILTFVISHQKFFIFYNCRYFRESVRLKSKRKNISTVKSPDTGSMSYRRFDHRKI